MSYMHEANQIAAALRGRAAPARRRGKAAGPSEVNLQVLAFMRTFFAANDQLPPVAVVAAHFGWSAGPSSADWHIKALINHGLLERNVLGKLRFARGVR